MTPLTSSKLFIDWTKISRSEIPEKNHFININSYYNLATKAYYSADCIITLEIWLSLPMAGKLSFISLKEYNRRLRKYNK